MELIEKNALIDWFMHGAFKYPRNMTIPVEVVLCDIANTPCVDAVPVIRCAACMFSEQRGKSGECWCNLHDTSMRNDSFCSFGRKVQNDNA